MMFAGDEDLSADDDAFGPFADEDDEDDEPSELRHVVPID